VSDYRSSHLAPDCPQRFDGHYTHGRGQLYWNAFERPYLEELFARLGRDHPGRYLDFACGTGRILALGAPHFSETVGIDVSAVMIEEARARVPRARVINADVMRDPPNVGTFDVISLFRFILSAEPELREGVLRWLRSVIAPTGVLVVNNHLNGRSVTGLAHRLEHRWNRQSGRSPIDDEIEALFGRCGFAVQERFGFGIIPPWRDRRLMPSAALLKVERLLGRSSTLQRYAKDRIFVCEPS